MGKFKSHNYHLLRLLSSQKKTCVKLNNLINILPGVKKTSPPDKIVLTERKGALTNACIPIATTFTVGIARAHENVLPSAPLESTIETTIKHDAIALETKKNAEIMLAKLTNHDLALEATVKKALGGLVQRIDAPTRALRESSTDIPRITLRTKSSTKKYQWLFQESKPANKIKKFAKFG